MIKTAEEIQRMSVAGALTAKVLEALDEVVRPGISTAEIDRFCERYIVDTLAARHRPCDPEPCRGQRLLGGP